MAMRGILASALQLGLSLRSRRVLTRVGTVMGVMGGRQQLCLNRPPAYAVALLQSSVAADGATMQQIADWLKELGLSEYGQRFAENGIDISVLRDLTDQDLKDIGVLLGHRRKLLRAIAELIGVEEGAPTLAPP